jgi:hypothetical protein
MWGRAVKCGAEQFQLNPKSYTNQNLTQFLSILVRTRLTEQTLFSRALPTSLAHNWFLLQLTDSGRIMLDSGHGPCRDL